MANIINLHVIFFKIHYFQFSLLIKYFHYYFFAKSFHFYKNLDHNVVYMLYLIKIYYFIIWFLKMTYPFQYLLYLYMIFLVQKIWT